MKKPIPFHHRIEIALWVIWVSIAKIARHNPLYKLSSPKVPTKRRSVKGLTIVVPVILACGGFFISRSPIFITHARDPNPIFLANPNQENILFITVDDLNNHQPQLISVWWILHLVSEPEFIFVPVYPIDWQQQPAKDLAFQELFTLENGHRLPKNFQELLHQREIFWSYSLVIDQAGLAKLRELFHAGNPPATAAKPSSNLAALEIQATQQILIHSLCHNQGDWLNTADPFTTLTMIKNHLTTDINTSVVIAGWAKLRHAPNLLSCEFMQARVMNKSTPPKP